MNSTLMKYLDTPGRFLSEDKAIEVLTEGRDTWVSFNLKFDGETVEYAITAHKIGAVVTFTNSFGREFSRTDFLREIQKYLPQMARGTRQLVNEVSRYVAVTL